MSSKKTHLHVRGSSSTTINVNVSAHNSPRGSLTGLKDRVSFSAQSPISSTSPSALPFNHPRMPSAPDQDKQDKIIKVDFEKFSFTENNFPDSYLPTTNGNLKSHQNQLDEWMATAIAGNDILSSILYTLGVVAAFAGRWTPVAFLIVTGGILYPFRLIYTELGAMIPLNGGSLNCIARLFEEDEYQTLPSEKPDTPFECPSFPSADIRVDVDSPTAASIVAPIWSFQAFNSHFARLGHRSSSLRTISMAVAATLSLLSYVSTAVVSAASATSYGAGEFLLLRDYVFILTFVVLALFAVVTLAGIRESGQFAFGIFVTHCSVLSVLLLAGLISIIRDKGRTLYDNIVLSDEDALKVGSIGSGFGFSNLYFGVCSAMLGVTGFETSSNYIEDQKPNVFPKTLRNMWLMVTILNPMMGVVLLGVFPLRDIPGNEANLVNLMAEQLIGPTFRSIVAADAVLALSGGALTAYIGVNGLLVRMVDEGLLPRFLSKRNSITGTHHRIIISFLFLTCTLYAGTKGKLTALNGVYTTSFLGVLFLAAGGCAALRYKIRKRYCRYLSTGQMRQEATLDDSVGKHQRTVWSWEIIAAIGAVLAGLLGQAIMNPQNFIFFAYYFCGCVIIILIYQLRFR